VRDRERGRERARASFCSCDEQRPHHTAHADTHTHTHTTDDTTDAKHVLALRPITKQRQSIQQHNQAPTNNKYDVTDPTPHNPTRLPPPQRDKEQTRGTDRKQQRMSCSTKQQRMSCSSPFVAGRNPPLPLSRAEADGLDAALRPAAVVLVDGHEHPPLRRQLVPCAVVDVLPRQVDLLLGGRRPCRRRGMGVGRKGGSGDVVCGQMAT
jgi:hypothetical protein